MLSKLGLSEAFHHFASTISPHESQFIYFPDDYIEKSLTDQLLTEWRKKSIQWKIFWGGGLNRDIFEQEILTQDLFNQTEVYLIFEAEKLSKDIRELISSKDLGAIHLVFFSKKKESFFQKLKIPGYEILLPPFWRQGELLDFFLQVQDLEIPSLIRNNILENVEATSASFHALTNRLHLCRSELSKMSKEEIHNFFDTTKFDFFQYVDFLNSKNFRSFFSCLLDQERSYDEFRSFFSFLLNHLQKIIAAPGQEKGRNRYEKEIEKARSRWSRDELLKVFKTFSRWEKLAKKQDPYLFVEIQLKRIQTF